MSHSLWPRLGYGVGLRTEHYGDLLAGKRRVDWFEAISENYMDTGGKPLDVLTRVRRDYPVALHGVAMSIGSADPLDRQYLRKLKSLIERIEPALVTDHLCWTSVGRRAVYDLMPLPYTQETLMHVGRRVRQVQDYLGRRIALENPSTYVQFCYADIPEWEFLAALAEAADCGILLDVNNVYVSAYNHGWDPVTYIDAMPPERVAQFHLAGFTEMRTYLFDTHSTPVHEDVWHLYAHAVRRFRGVATLVEWDADIPSFDRLCAEVRHARRITETIHGKGRLAVAHPARSAASAGSTRVASRAA
jgi:uncharacterized protein (UPF0276 family)